MNTTNDNDNTLRPAVTRDDGLNQAPIPEALSQLDDATEELYGRVETLRGQLAAVMGPPTQEPDTPQDPEPEPACYLVGQLDNFRARVNDISDAVSAVQHRLAL